jgi:hypothetical protein
VTSVEYLALLAGTVLVAVGTVWNLFYVLDVAAGVLAGD